MDCSHEFWNNGCVGGLPENVFKYIKNYGISFEKNNPYIGDKKQCNWFTLTDKFKLNDLKYVVLDNHVMALIAAL